MAPAAPKKEQEYTPNLMEMTHTDVAAHIRVMQVAEQNDLVRQALNDDAILLRNAGNGIRCKVVLTPGISGEEPDFIKAVFEAVVAVKDFSKDNDPYALHDFGSVQVQGQTVFWKVDFYDVNYEYASEDMADLSITRRVLTIMLASEY